MPGQWSPGDSDSFSLLPALCQAPAGLGIALKELPGWWWGGGGGDTSVHKLLEPGLGGGPCCDLTQPAGRRGCPGGGRPGQAFKDVLCRRGGSSRSGNGGCTRELGQRGDGVGGKAGVATAGGAEASCLSRALTASPEAEARGRGPEPRSQPHHVQPSDLGHVTSLSEPQLPCL